MKVQETLAVLREHFPGEELYFQAVGEVLSTIEEAAQHIHRVFFGIRAEFFFGR